MVTSCANIILWNAHTGSSPAPVVGDDWVNRFLNCHSEYFVRKQKSIDADRKKAYQRHNIWVWFAKYKIVSKEIMIQHCDQYNFDKTGGYIDIGRDQWIITPEPNAKYIWILWQVEHWLLFTKQ